MKEAPAVIIAATAAPIGSGACGRAGSPLAAHAASPSPSIAVERPTRQPNAGTPMSRSDVASGTKGRSAAAPKTANAARLASARRTNVEQARITDVAAKSGAA